MSARMGSCSRESSWGSASGLADCSEEGGHNPDGYVGPIAQHHHLRDGNPPPDHQNHPFPPHAHTQHSLSGSFRRDVQQMCLWEGDTGLSQPTRSYLTQDIHGQVHQPQNVPLVPWVQHADVVGDVVGAALRPS